MEGTQGRTLADNSASCQVRRYKDRHEGSEGSEGMGVLTSLYLFRIRKVPPPQAKRSEYDCRGNGSISVSARRVREPDKHMSLRRRRTAGSRLQLGESKPGPRSSYQQFIRARQGRELTNV